MKRWILLLCTILPFILLSCSIIPKKAPATRFQGEESPTFKAGDILSSEIIKGNNYSIADKVPVEQYHYAFTVKSDFGDIPALGKEVLELRLRELHAIEEAQRRTKDPHFVNGVLKPIKQAGKGLQLLITDPYNTLKNMPRGLGMMLSQFTDAADRRAGSPARRKLATQLDCDPETTNPVLKKLLDEMSMSANAGLLLTEVAIAFVPGLTALSMTADTKELIAKLPPSEINKEIDKELESLGVEEYLRKKFIETPVFTTLQRLLFMEHYRKLKDIQNHHVLVENAAAAFQETEALGLIHVTKMFVELDRSKSIIRFESVPGLPLCILKDGTYTLIVPADYMTYTKEIEDRVALYRKNHPDANTVIIITGLISSNARQIFDRASIEVVENGQLSW